MRYRVEGCLLLVCVSMLGMSPLLAQGEAAAQPGGSLAQDADLLNLDEALPMRIEDANVLRVDVAEARFSFSPYRNEADSCWQAEMAVAWGFAPHLEAVVGTTLRNNRRSDAGDGDVYLKVLGQCYDAPGRDALLLGATLNFPTGQDYARVDASIPPYSFVINQRQDEIDIALFGVWTRILDASAQERLHLEAKTTMVRSAPRGFRSERWFFAGAYDKLVRPNTLGMVGVWWEQRPSLFVPSSSALQVGLRHRESAHLILSGSLDLGLDWQEADWGFTFGGQYRFH